jgi:hypothetical protein
VYYDDCNSIIDDLNEVLIIQKDESSKQNASIFSGFVIVKPYLYYLIL